jgi:hypothetical protein
MAKIKTVGHTLRSIDRSKNLKSGFPLRNPITGAVSVSKKAPQTTSGNSILDLLGRRKKKKKKPARTGSAETLGSYLLLNARKTRGDRRRQTGRLRKGGDA